MIGELKKELPYGKMILPWAEHAALHTSIGRFVAAGWIFQPPQANVSWVMCYSHCRNGVCNSSIKNPLWTRAFSRLISDGIGIVNNLYKKVNWARLFTRKGIKEGKNTIEKKLFRLFPIISISQKFFSIFFLTLEKIGLDEKVIC